jgi:acyl transferase domain-containing protein/NAD(P)-dependent dehydrogenase (short-subunit alcohol dehydrogenase family)/acyl carrier protein
MEETAYRAIAIVGVGAILPDAPNAPAFWNNIKEGRYSISEVTPDRWDPALHYDADPKAPDKTYSKIGGWVRESNWDPVAWHLPIPPRVAGAMDEVQKWAVASAHEALVDYGYPERQLDPERTAVILGNAMAGEQHYLTTSRVLFPEYARALGAAPDFARLSAGVREAITTEFHANVDRLFPPITEDTMPGELANCLAGRIANLFNFHGPNYVVDAACASAMAAISAAVEGLIEHDFDAVITGGIDRNMGVATFTKFCKIGALSATGTRPFADGADGFVMGEGAAIFILKRLADAERDGDKIYAVLRGIGGASDGKGKGITAPNPVGQKLSIERAWQNAGLSPATASLIEGHGTSTRVGDVVEVESLSEIFARAGTAPGSIPLGSVKSNIGHLKGAAGGAGLLKTVLALHDRVLPPSLNFARPNPNIDFPRSPFYVNTELKPWPAPGCGVRRAGVSAFGFGGTNFHVVLEEYIPGRLANGNNGVGTLLAKSVSPSRQTATAGATVKAPRRGALLLGAPSTSVLVDRLRAVRAEAMAGHTSAPCAPAEQDLRAPERISIDYSDAADLADKAGSALKAFEAADARVWKALRARGIFRGSGPAPKVAFLYTGQGSQYVNMLDGVRRTEPVVAEVFAEADRTMTPLLGEPLTDYIFADISDAAAVEKAEEDLRQTSITQPAVLTVDTALTRLLAEYGVKPDMVMGHSLGEYGALVEAGALPFDDALLAVSARGRAMSRVSVEDNGWMVAVFAPLEEVERILDTVDGNVVIANINSTSQAVIGGASAAVERAMQAFLKAGYNAVRLPVSHAFHTSIVAPASGPLRTELERLRLSPPHIPIVANVTGQFYPMGPDVVPQMLDLLARQVASPVQFVKGLKTLYDAGARVFVEVGPKRALQGFVDDVLGDRDVFSLATNHPKMGEDCSFNVALCGLYAAGLGAGVAESPALPIKVAATASDDEPSARGEARDSLARAAEISPDRYSQLGHLFAEFLERGMQVYKGDGSGPVVAAQSSEAVVITGAAVGLPGTERIFDDLNVSRILHGEQFIDVIPNRFRRAMLDKHITRLVKRENGSPTFETITDPNDVIKLAARGGRFDLAGEFGVLAERLPALDVVTRLAIGAGLDALRDAGIPLVMRYKETTKGTRLPAGWGLPEALRDDTGIIFASAFPGFDSFADILTRYHADRARRERLADLESLRSRANGDDALGGELDRRIAELSDEIEQNPFAFDRLFLFRCLSMGHSQFAELIGARGPNTQINAACASGTQAVGLAEDWIRAGRCRRVVIVSADNVTSDNLLEWFAAGFLASGAAATDDTVENAAIPFDRRRHGMIIGMGAAAMVVESAGAARERGVRPITEVLNVVTGNSAFHGTRLDVEHISSLMEQLVAQAESRWGISRGAIAPETVFVSHETYTPARGGSASAEIHALRRVFGPDADRIVIANTKGVTGHAMATGLEDATAVKILETGIVPPVANFKEVDPELGPLNLSKGGSYPVRYALRLGAGFGSQISLMLVRWAPPPSGARQRPDSLGYAYRIENPAVWNAWISNISGYPTAELEVAHRTLRVKDQGTPARFAHPATEAQTVLAPSPAAVPPVAPSTLSANVARVSVEPTPAPVPAKAEATASDDVKERILALVVEKTGYPEDMLDLDLDLEADLGVDTVKQAELFASVREAYDIPRDTNLRLRDFPTLAHVIQFVLDRRPDLAAATAPIDTAVPAAVPSAAAQAAPTQAVPVHLADDPVKERVLDLLVDKTGYPRDMLDLDLDLEADLGIDTVKQAELFAAVRAEYDIPRDENLKLRDFPTIAHTIKFVYDRRPDLSTVAAATVKPAAAGVPEIPAAESDTTEDAITKQVLALVAEKTGYPEDMLDLDLDLEADLGIDTVKQAEIFAAARALFDIPRDENLKLRDFPTIAHVIRFMRERQPKASVGQIAEPTGAASTDACQPPVVTNTEAADRVPRRVPAPQLRPPLNLCKQTGVILAAGSRVMIMSDAGGVGRELAARLARDGVETLVIEGSPDAEELKRRIEGWRAAGSVQGVFWLPALDDEGPIANMNLEGWRAALHPRVKLLYTTMRVLYDQVAGPGTFLVSATRLGGQHGYDEAGAFAPLGGAVVGFTKAYKRERAEALVKAVDFGPGLEPAKVAGLLIEETLRDPGAVEIGYRDDQRWTVGLRELPASNGQPGLTLTKETVFVVTGAAGSIVSAITADLAASSGGRFYLLDLVPEPDPANPDIAQFATDKEGLKRDIFERLKAKGERATPAMVEKELARLERLSAALSAIRAVKNAGGVARYYSVDLKDAEAVARVVDEIRGEVGRVDVLVHAAGLEISRSLPDKEPREFDLVLGVKCDGWFNLMHAIGDMPLGVTIAFSSIAGRFGNGGQVDYSAANDLLCKLTSNLRATRPETRGIAIDWTAWADIGMASRGSIPKMMELAGIDMLPPQVGIPTIRRELTSGSTRGEIVVAGSLGALAAEFDSTGGLDAESAALAARKPMLGRAVSARLYGGLTVETTLDPAAQPFLNDHRIEGTPVLPGVMGLEGFAEVATLLLPGWHVAAIEEVRFLAPFKFYRGEPRQLTIEATIWSEAGEIRADCRLTGKRVLARQSEQQTTHFTARVRLARQSFSETASAPPVATSSRVEAPAVYEIYFHGPAYQVIDSVWRAGSQVVGAMVERLPANHNPADLPTLVAPRLIELCFQTAGVLEIAAKGKMGLPRQIESVRAVEPSEVQGRLFAIVTPDAGGETFNARVVDEAGTVFVDLRGYGTAELPNEIEARKMAPLAAMAARASGD